MPSVHSIKDILLKLDPVELNVQVKEVPTDVPVSQTTALLSLLEGQYYSSELDTFYRIHVREDKLVLSHIRHGEQPMTLVKDEHYQLDFYPMRDLAFSRDESGKIIGLYASNPRVKNVWFEKVK